MRTHLTRRDETRRRGDNDRSTRTHFGELLPDQENRPRMRTGVWRSAGAVTGRSAEVRVQRKRSDERSTEPVLHPGLGSPHGRERESDEEAHAPSR